MSTERAPRPTIAEVASAAKVSRTTVSMALSGKGRIDPRTRAHVAEVAARLGYRPNVRAQRLRGGRSHTVALVTALPPSIVGEASELGFLLDMALPMAQACLEHGYSLLLVPPLSDAGYLDSLDVDGAIVIDPVVDDPYCASFRRRGVRVVTVGRADGASVDGAVDRGFAGADIVLDHLVRAGARRAAVITSFEEHSLSATLARDLPALASSVGLDCTLVQASAAGGQQAGFDATLSLLDQDPDVDAIYAPLDAFALGAVDALRQLGRRVPDDVLIATNYDGPRARTSNPQLTALDLRLAEMARSAMSMLLTGIVSSEFVTVSAPAPRIIARESTRRPVAP